MSTNGRSKNRSKKKATAKSRKPSSKAIDRPFDPRILAEAERIASTYSYVIEPNPEDGDFVGHTLELPLVLGDGPTGLKCIASVREAAITSIAVMLENKQSPPEGATSPRSEQVNIRLTSMERLRIEHAARRAGFRSVSDYIRSAALGKAS